MYLGTARVTVQGCTDCSTGFGTASVNQGSNPRRRSCKRNKTYCRHKNSNGGTAARYEKGVIILVLIRCILERLELWRTALTVVLALGLTV
jgi:hypothetical protein